MNVMPQVIPVTDLRMKYPQVIKRLGSGPILLAQRSKPTAVLISVPEWDAIAIENAALRREIEQLRDQVDVLEAELEFVQAGEALEEFDPHEFPALIQTQTVSTSGGQFTRVAEDESAYRAGS